jgi:hypothetical protein
MAQLQKFLGYSGNLILIVPSLIYRIVVDSHRSDGSFFQSFIIYYGVYGIFFFFTCLLGVVLLSSVYFLLRRLITREKFQWTKTSIQESAYNIWIINGIACWLTAIFSSPGIVFVMMD